MQIATKTNGEALEFARQKSKSHVLKKIKQSGLSGRGGARFPTWLKIDSVMKAPDKEKYLICNAEEGEPGTLKDGFIMEHHPELLIEGMMILAHLINPKKSYIYLNKKYKHLRLKLNKVIKKFKANIEIRLSLDKYICGEESTVIEFLEGKPRGKLVPRDRPPYPTTVGLHGKPTCVSNVETLSNIPLILTQKDWNRKLQLFSITGDVKKPGVYEIELGTRLKDIIKLAGPKDPKGPKGPKAVYFAYAGGCIPYKKFKSLRVDNDNVKKAGCELGARSLIVFGKDKSIPKTAFKLSKFFYKEACGKCVPCRKGNYYFYRLMKQLCEEKLKKSDLKEMEDIARYIKITSFCGLGKASTTYLTTSLKYFRKEFEALCR